MFEIKQTAAFAKWERKLKDPMARVRIAARIARLESGLMGDVSPIGESVSELRIHCGPGYRVYFTQKGSQIILLLCGGDKSSQRRDIETAIELAKKWRE